MSLFTVAALIVLVASAQCSARAHGIEAEAWRTGFRTQCVLGPAWDDFPRRVVEELMGRARRWHRASGVLAAISLSLCVAGWVIAW